MEADARLGVAFGDPAFARAALEAWRVLVDRPEPVTDAVGDVLGRPARSLAEWAHEHRAAFEAG